MVKINPSRVNMVTIEREYNVAFFIPCILVWLRFKKKLTVTGNIAYKQGCKTEMTPQRRPSRNVVNNDFSGKLTGDGVED